MQHPALPLKVSLIQARQAHRLHRVHMLEAGLCRVGHGTKRVFLGEQMVAVTAGQWVLLPAHVPLDVENEPGPHGYQAQVLSFAPQLLAEFHQSKASHLPPPSGPVGLDRWRLPANARLDATWQRLQQSLADEESPVLQKHLLHELWLVIGLSGRLWPLLSHTPGDLSLRVQQLLMSDPSADWSQERVATWFHMSSPTLRRHLAAEGQTFRSLLDNVRMAYALNHVQTSRRSIEDIAQACGYASPSRFAVRFRQQFGLSPRALRKAL